MTLFRKSKDRLLSYLEKQEYPCCLISKQNTIRYANPSFTKLFPSIPFQTSEVVLDTLLSHPDLKNIRQNADANPKEKYPLLIHDTLFGIKMTVLDQSVLLEFIPYYPDPDQLNQIIRHYIHDVRNPLATAMMALSNLQFTLNKASFKDPLIDEFLDTAYQSCISLKSIIENLGTFLRQDRQYFQLKDPLMVIENAVSITGTPCSTDFQYALNEFLLDERSLQMAFQIILNLFNDHFPDSEPLHIKSFEFDDYYNAISLSNDKRTFYNREELILSEFTNHEQLNFNIARSVLNIHGVTLCGFIKPKEAFNLSVLIPKQTDEYHGKNIINR